ncbi:MAG: hypothetical protein ACMXYF_02350, partial [Candidatus Woesearchaeota archaeon]
NLEKTASNRISFLETNKDERFLNYVFEGYYSSLIELLHAKLLLDGFKVENHICIGYYIRDVLKDVSLFQLFDDFRYKRNSLIYYGKEMDDIVVKKTLHKMVKTIKEVQNILLDK